MSHPEDTGYAVPAERVGDVDHAFLPASVGFSVATPQLIQAISPYDPALQGICALVRKVFNAPVAGISLIDHEGVDERVISLAPDVQRVREELITRKSQGESIDSWVLVPVKPEALVVYDLSKDIRFKNTSSVASSPGLRFYAGAPLIASSGGRIGVLFSAEFAPRSCRTDTVALLCNLAELVVQEVEERIAPHKHNPLLRLHRRFKQGYRPIMIVNTAGHNGEEGGGASGNGGWPVLYQSSSWPFEAGATSSTSPSFFGTFTGGPGDRYSNFTNVNLTFRVAVRYREDPLGRELLLELRPATSPVWDDMVRIRMSHRLADPTSMYCSDAVSSLYCAVLISVSAPCPGKAQQPVSISPTASDGASPVIGDAEPVQHEEEVVMAAPEHSLRQNWPFCLPWDDVILGPLLGMGCHGSTYRASWGEDRQPAAVKVLFHLDRADTSCGQGHDLAGRMHCALKSVVRAALQHPHVVTTHRFAVVAPPPPDVLPQATPPGPPPLPQQQRDAPPAKRQRPANVGEGLQQQQEGGEEEAQQQQRQGGKEEAQQQQRQGGKEEAQQQQRQGGAEEEGEEGAETSTQGSAGGNSGGGSSDGGSGGGVEPRIGRQAKEEAAARGSQIWVLLEYCGRGSLMSAIESSIFRVGRDPGGGPNMAAILTIAQQVALGMAYLHSRGMVHGDLSPRNVLLADRQVQGQELGSGGGDAGGRGSGGEESSSYDGDGLDFVAKVSDVGAAHECASGDASHLEFSTITHMSPEMLMQQPATCAADVYAFGVILWEMYTGRRPYAGCSVLQVVSRRLVCGGRNELHFPDGTPTPYRALAGRCMSLDASQRPSFQEVTVQLQEMMTDAE